MRFAVNVIKGGKIGKACRHKFMQRHLVHGVYYTEVLYRNTHRHTSRKNDSRYSPTPPASVTSRDELKFNDTMHKYPIILSCCE